MPQTFVDLGRQAVANSYVPMEKAGEVEPNYTLHTRVCQNCWLVQVDEDVPADLIFTSDYAYFSSFSASWLEHAKVYAEKMTAELGLGSDSLVIEIASNDGYLLKNFVAAGVPVLGVEPSGSVAAAAEKIGVPTIVEFFGESVATKLFEDGRRPDLICSANVLAHVPDINDFVAGVAKLLTGDAIYTVEFPHLLNLINHVQFDTIYHEHYSYLSLLAVETIFAKYGLRVFEVEEFNTHGGSLRVYACLEDASHAERSGMLAFLKQAKSEGKTVASYGAAAKGNTLLNYCQVGPEDIALCVDKNPAKQNTLLPGSKIPVKDVDALYEMKPDYVVILPWNLKREISEQLSELRAHGTQFVTAVPEISIS